MRRKERKVPKMPETLGGRIIQFRRRAKMSQAHLAGEAGVDAGYLSRIERTQVYPSNDVLAKLAQTLDVEADELKEETVYFDSDSTAICPNFNCTLAGEKPDSWTPYSVKRVTSSGEVNWFCPHCGSFLIDRCPSCGRAIQDMRTRYCAGCGKDLVTHDPMEPPEKILSDLPEA